MNKVIVLLSGGIDSSTILYEVVSKGKNAYPLVIDYNQRHKKELLAAMSIARSLNLEKKTKLLNINLGQIGGSSLTEKQIKVPKFDTEIASDKDNVPNTYVPFRNSILLSLAVAYAEVIDADEIYLGNNLDDYNNYPDCRPDFIEAMNNLIKYGTNKQNITVKAPLLQLSKEEIIKKAKNLNVPFELTWTCYKGAETPCGECESCITRQKAFQRLDITDPLNP